MKLYAVFSRGARSKCLIRLTLYPPLPVSKQFCRHTLSLDIADIEYNFCM